MTVGSVIFDIHGQQLTSEDKSMLRHPSCAGIIFFARQDAPVQAIRSLTQEILDINPQAIICVDQEGGRVQRFKKEFTPLPKPSYFGSCYQKDKQAACALAKQTGHTMALELKRVGVDISFAPVVDIMSIQSGVLKDRTFSSTKEGIESLAEAFMQGMHSAQMPATLKHFPGHGGVEVDSHLALPIDTRDKEALAVDLDIFAALVKKGAQAVMPAHVIYPAIDDMPAGFSKVWLQEILRDQLGFTGVVFSDDLTMKATEQYGDYSQRTQIALQAGCDYILVCQNRSGAIAALEAAQRVKANKDSEQRRHHYQKRLVESRQAFSTI